MVDVAQDRVPAGAEMSPQHHLPASGCSIYTLRDTRKPLPLFTWGLSFPAHKTSTVIALTGWAWCHRLIIPATKETEAGELSVQASLGNLGKLSLNTKSKNWSWGYHSVLAIMPQLLGSFSSTNTFTYPDIYITISDVYTISLVREGWSLNDIWSPAWSKTPLVLT